MQALDWRPTTFREYIGQPRMMSLLRNHVDASIAKKAAMPHMVLYGGQGLGKTSIVHVLGHERRSEVITVMGKSLNDEMLTHTLCYDLPADGYGPKGEPLNRNAMQFPILVIEEAEAVPRATWETLHMVLEPGADGRRIFEAKVPRQRIKRKVWVPEFTMILLTNYFGDLKNAAMAAVARCRVQLQVDPYTDDEVDQIIKQFAKINRFRVSDDAVRMLATRCHGVPRDAINLFKDAMCLIEAQRHRNEANVQAVTPSIVEQACEMHGIDSEGLRETHRQYLRALAGAEGGKMGVESLAAVLRSDSKTIRDLEAILLQKELITVVSGGRQVTEMGLQKAGPEYANPVMSRLA